MSLSESQMKRQFDVWSSAKKLVTRVYGPEEWLAEERTRPRKVWEWYLDGLREGRL